MERCNAATKGTTDTWSYTITFLPELSCAPFIPSSLPMTPNSETSKNVAFASRKSLNLVSRSHITARALSRLMHCTLPFRGGDCNGNTNGGRDEMINLFIRLRRGIDL